MIQKPVVWLRFLASWFVLANIAAVQGQLVPGIEVEVTEENGLFTYDYTVTNPAFSSGEVNVFLLSVAQGSGVVSDFSEPDGWTGDYTESELNFQMGFITGDGLTCGETEGEIGIGESASFSLTSRFAPEPMDYYLTRLTAECLPEGDEWAGLVAAPSVEPEPEVTCDFNGDGTCDVIDIDLLGGVIQAESHLADYDLTMDGLVNLEDLDAFLTDPAVNRLNGDTNLDGNVDFADFLVHSNNFSKEGIPWSGGNFNLNASVDFPDFLVLSNNFGQAPAAAVPEPSTMMLASATLLATLVWRRRKATS